MTLEEAIKSSVGMATQPQKKDNRDEDGQRELTFAESKRNYYAKQTSNNVDQRAVDFVNSDKVSLTLAPTQKDRLMKKALDGATLEEVEGLYQQMYEIQRINHNARENKKSQSEIDLDIFNR